MQTSIGKKFRTRKVKLVYEKRLLKQKENELIRDIKLKEINEMGGVRFNEGQSLLNKNNIENDKFSQSNKNMADTLAGSTDNNGNMNNKKNYDQGNYDTVTSVHDIDQDGHVYNFPVDHRSHLLPRISEIPSATRANNNRSSSVSDVSEKV
jgi:hypothetical protein